MHAHAAHAPQKEGRMMEVIFLKVSSKGLDGIFRSITSIVQPLGCGTPSAAEKRHFETFLAFGPKKFQRHLEQTLL